MLYLQSFGRQMIEQTKNKVQEIYTVANGYAADAEARGADTQHRIPRCLLVDFLFRALLVHL